MNTMMKNSKQGAAIPPSLKEFRQPNKFHLMLYWKIDNISMFTALIAYKITPSNNCQ